MVASESVTSNTNSQNPQNLDTHHQHAALPYGNNPFPNLNLAEMADHEDSMMLLDNCWFFPMTSPSINLNMNGWPQAGVHLDENENIWDGSAFHPLNPLPVDSQNRPNDEFMDLEYGNHRDEGTGYHNL